ncbi:MAG: pyruvate kinase [Phycisphaerales bacterium]|nr:pyruvate kinase [Phycisphaerales bacterium]
MGTDRETDASTLTPTLSLEGRGSSTSKVPMHMIRTKIVATMGPAVGNVELLYGLFQAGVDVCRLNFSHGNLEEHLLMLRRIREAAARWDQPIAILGDLGGPKIRLGKVADQNNTGGMPINVGDELLIQREQIVGANGKVSTTLSHFVDDVNVGDRVLIEDGMLRFVCTAKTFSELRCTCTVGGVLKSSKGINLPNSTVNVPSITDRDWECVDWAIENDLDYLALSFVRKAEDLQLLRQHLTNKVSDIHLIAKIEKPEALKQIDAIIDASDGLMVARGDLGVEMDVAQVPIIQKDLVARCQTAGKPAIVATQMLQSMIEQASPTRAEVSDVANAIFDGADAVMLSGETSVGKFPLGVVHTMAHIAEVTEEYLCSHTPKEPPLKLKTMSLSSALAKGVWQMTQDLKVTLVVIWSQTGATARIFSKMRFPVPVLALSSDHRALRRMALHYGVLPLEMAAPRGMADLVEIVDRALREKGYANVGSRVLIVAGSSLGTPGTMNGVVIHTVGETWKNATESGAGPGLDGLQLS